MAANLRNDVTPRLATNHGTDGRLVHVESRSDLLLRNAARGHLSNLSHRRFCQFRAGVGAPPGFAATSLRVHVRKIVGHGSNRKMPCVYAGRVIARVHDDHAIGGRSAGVHFPSYPVSGTHLSADLHLSVSPILNGCRPDDAAVIGFSGFGPKARHKFFSKHWERLAHFPPAIHEGVH